jgi:transposase
VPAKWQHLLPYCPELNPVERFFEELRKDLSNQVDQDIEAAENHLADILTPSFNNNDKVIKLTNYSYLRTN